MCVLGGDWRFPDENSSSAKGKAKPNTSAASGSSQSSGERGISEPVKDIVRKCLQVEPADRPDIDELIQLIQNVIKSLPDGSE